MTIANQVLPNELVDWKYSTRRLRHGVELFSFGYDAQEVYKPGEKTS